MTQLRFQVLSPWFLAMRPKTLTAALVPVVVGTALAISEGFAIQWNLVLSALFVAVWIQIGTNLINDALDSKKGADTPRRLGPARVTQMGMLSGDQVLMGGVGCFCLAILSAIPILIQGGILIACLLAIAILMGYLYTGGPYPLAYYGLGDLFVLLFFGLIGTMGVYYLQSGLLPLSSAVAGMQVGLLATVLIAINNLRDYDEDRTTGKKTLAVRFGKQFVRIEITLCALIPFALSFYWLSRGQIFEGLLPNLALPLGMILVRAIWKTEPSSRYNQFLALGALLQLLFGGLFALGVLWG